MGAYLASAFGDGTMDDPFGSDPSLGGASFDAAFTIIPVIMGVIIITAIIVAVYRASKLAQQGKNPLTIDNDLRAAALDRLRTPDAANSSTGPAKTLEQRLREVDDLRARGVISEAEHATARAAILAG